MICSGYRLANDLVRIKRIDLVRIERIDKLQVVDRGLELSCTVNSNEQS
jgi:hypothetical protein